MGSDRFMEAGRRRYRHSPPRKQRQQRETTILVKRRPPGLAISSDTSTATVHRYEVTSVFCRVTIGRELVSVSSY